MSPHSHQGRVMKRPRLTLRMPVTYSARRSGTGVQFYSGKQRKCHRTDTRRSERPEWLSFHFTRPGVSKSCPCWLRSHTDAIVGSDGCPQSHHKRGSTSPIKLKVEVRGPDWGRWPRADAGFQVGTELESRCGNIQNLGDWGMLRERQTSQGN